MVKITPPPSTISDREVYNYLFQLAEYLEIAEKGGGSSGSEEQSALSASGGGEKKDQGDEYQELKALIIKTADKAYRRVDEMRTSLSGEYVAQSDFGTYVEKLNAELVEDPSGMDRYYSFVSALQANIGAVSTSFSNYRVSVEGHIRTGIVYYDGAIPIYGVAVGQNIRSVEVDGEQVIQQAGFRAIYAANRMSFWQDETEVAYMSDNQLYITNVVALSTLTIGEWKISTTNGLTFKWIGG